jgi:hypothetical protein
MVALTKGIDSHHSFSWLSSLQSMVCHHYYSQLTAITTVRWLPSL